MSKTVEQMLDELVEKHYQLRLEHNHYDMKWYAYYAGRGQRKLHDDDNDWNSSGDTPLEAVQALYDLTIKPTQDAALIMGDPLGDFKPISQNIHGVGVYGVYEVPTQEGG